MTACAHLLTKLQSRLTDLLSSVSLAFFILQLSEFRTAGKKYGRPSHLTNRKFWNAFLRPHHEDRVRQLALACPTLQHVSLDIMGDAPTYWTIERTEEAISLTILEPCVGQELARSEGLAYVNRAFLWKTV